MNLQVHSTIHCVNCKIQAVNFKIHKVKYKNHRVILTLFIANYLYGLRRVCKFAVDYKGYDIMLKYYKLEQRDSLNMKATRSVYKLRHRGHVDAQRFIEYVAHRHGFSESVIKGVLADVADELEYLLGRGYSVAVPEVGAFSLGIRLAEERKDKLEDEQDTAAEAAEAGKKAPKVAEPNARKMELHHINFRIDKSFFKKVASGFDRETLQREGGSEGVRITIDNKKQSERIAAAHQFLAKNPFMRIGDYAAITGLSRSSAQRELHELEKFKFSGITSRGSGSHRIWVRSEEE